MSGLLKDMLLIEDPSTLILAKEISIRASYFVLPCFLLALAFEYLGKFEFLAVGKKLIIVMLILATFSSIHHKAVDVSLSSAEELLKKVSPRNLFLRKWTESKMKTSVKVNAGWFDRFVVPDLNDLIATAFFLLSKVFIWLLKLIYSAVFHLTNIFAPLCALLYFFEMTKDSIGFVVKGTLWCILYPFVLVCILAMVGNSLSIGAMRGELSIASIDTIIWLFGVTFMIIGSAAYTCKLMGGGVVSQMATSIGATSTMVGMKAVRGLSGIMKDPKSSSSNVFQNIKAKGGSFLSSKRNNNSSNNISKNGNNVSDSTYSQKQESQNFQQDHSNQINQQTSQSQVRSGNENLKTGISNSNQTSIDKGQKNTMNSNKAIVSKNEIKNNSLTNNINPVPKQEKLKQSSNLKNNQTTIRRDQWNTKTLKPASLKKIVNLKSTSQGSRLS